MNKSSLYITAMLALFSLSAFMYLDHPKVEDRVLTCAPPSNNPTINTWNYQLPGHRIEPKQIELGFYINGVFGNYTTEQALEDPELLFDVIPDFPKNWIQHYKSVKVLVSHNGDITTKTGKDIQFTPEQKELLQSAVVGDRVEFEVKYLRPNSISEEMEERVMNFDLWLKPEKEANYSGGLKELVQILEDASKLDEQDRSRLANQDPITRIAFTINESGRADNIEVVESSRIKSLDNQLIRALEEMPEWEAARDKQGKAVNQSFEFLVGKPGC